MTPTIAPASPAPAAQCGAFLALQSNPPANSSSTIPTAMTRDTGEAEIEGREGHLQHQDEKQRCRQKKWNPERGCCPECGSKFAASPCTLILGIHSRSTVHKYAAQMGRCCTFT